MSPDEITLASFLDNLLSFVGGDSAFSSFGRFAAHLWLWVVVVGYVLTFAGLAAIVYMLMRIFDLRAREQEYYETLIAPADGPSAVHSRWERIRALAGGESPSAWREAIIEADIMLDELLAGRGYTGVGVGEKLRQVTHRELASVQEAWEAHKVRNQIAHEGSSFDLSPTMVSRTLARYEAVFRELGAA